ncbi:MAG: hypothetical protein BWZ07_03070 [Alphaproteobacteria bacterium ADurb.BinA280]|nr:MAG: hypothetical protein BWZ07_03070 [Alphaproteobacteria bacterium ADurb.BinA280]
MLPALCGMLDHQRRHDASVAARHRFRCSFRRSAVARIRDEPGLPLPRPLRVRHENDRRPRVVRRRPAVHPAWWLSTRVSSDHCHRRNRFAARETRPGRNTADSTSHRHSSRHLETARAHGRVPDHPVPPWPSVTSHRCARLRESSRPTSIPLPAIGRPRRPNCRPPRPHLAKRPPLLRCHHRPGRQRRLVPTRRKHRSPRCRHQA